MYYVPSIVESNEVSSKESHVAFSEEKLKALTGRYLAAKKGEETRGCGVWVGCYIMGLWWLYCKDILIAEFDHKLNDPPRNFYSIQNEVRERTEIANSYAPLLLFGSYFLR